MDNFLLWASTSFFLLTAILYLYDFFAESRKESNFARLVLISSILINLIYMGNLAFIYKRFPLATLSEALDFIAMALAVSYLAIEILTKNKNTGFLITGLVFAVKAVSLSLERHSGSVNPILGNGYFVLHVIPSALGYTAFSLSMIYATLYLALYKELHEKSPGTFFRRLPPLEVMETMIRHSVKLGFVLLTLGMAAGFMLMKSTFGIFFRFDPKILFLALIWGLYLLFLVCARSFAWKGRKYAIVSIIGFVIIVLSLAVIELFFRSFHNFV